MGFANPPVTVNIVYNKSSFDSNFDKLNFVADHEMSHRTNVLAGKYKDVQLTDKVVAKEEYSTYIYNYKRQGLYPNHNMDLSLRINGYGTAAGIDYDTILNYSFETPWWHFIYKIQRRW